MVWMVTRRRMRRAGIAAALAAFVARLLADSTFRLGNIDEVLATV